MVLGKAMDLLSQPASMWVNKEGSCLGIEMPERGREGERGGQGERGRERKRNSKTLIFEDSSVRFIWTCLTASPCCTANTNKHTTIPQRGRGRAGMGGGGVST